MSVQTQTVTLLYYEEHNPLQLRSVELEAHKSANEQRWQLSPEQRQGRLIVAVLAGHAELLNTLGERFDSKLSAA